MLVNVACVSCHENSTSGRKGNTAKRLVIGLLAAAVASFVRATIQPPDVVIFEDRCAEDCHKMDHTIAAP